MHHSIPKETLAELLLYVAEHEEFSSLKKIKTVTQKQFSSALKELAQDLIDSSLEQGNAVKTLMDGLSKKTREVLEKLPKEDRIKLIKGFLD